MQIIEFLIDQQRPVNRYLDIIYLNFVRMAVLSFDNRSGQIV